MIELRRDGLSTYEISARLADEGTPLNRTSVAETRMSRVSWNFGGGPVIIRRL